MTHLLRILSGGVCDCTTDGFLIAIHSYSELYGTRTEFGGVRAFPTVSDVGVHTTFCRLPPLNTIRTYTHTHISVSANVKKQVRGGSHLAI